MKTKTRQTLQDRTEKWLNEIEMAGALATRAETVEMLDRAPDPSHPTYVELARQVNDPDALFGCTFAQKTEA